MTVFRVDDLDAAFEHVQASGAEVLKNPLSSPCSAAQNDQRGVTCQRRYWP